MENNKNIDRELGKIETQITHLKERQDTIERDFKTEVSSLKSDVKDLKREFQGDFKELKNTMEDVKNSVNSLNIDNVKVKTSWKVITIIASATSGIIFLIYKTVEFIKALV